MVPAFNNTLNGGLFQRTNSFYAVNGNRVNVTLYTGFVRRAGKKNPIIMIGGVLPWRSPSTYDRLATKWTYTSANLLVNGSTRITGAYLNPEIAHTGGTYDSHGVLVLNTGRSSIDTNNQARANTECMLKINEQKVNVGNMLGEAKSTVNMLADTTSQLYRLLLAFKRGDWRFVRSYLGTNSIANGYLQWAYGWKPLCSDIKGLYDLSQEKIKPPMIFDAKRSISFKDSYVSSQSGIPNLRTSILRINSCHIYAQMSASQLATAQSFGLVNPLSLMWELIPYSFVIDWAMPVGNFFGALTAPAGFTYVGGYTSQRTQTIAVGLGGSGGGTGTQTEIKRESFDFQRFALGGFPAPSLYVKSPFSTSHTASALALGRQLFI